MNYIIFINNTEYKEMYNIHNKQSRSNVQKMYRINADRICAKKSQKNHVSHLNIADRLTEKRVDSWTDITNSHNRINSLPKILSFFNLYV